MKRALKDRVEKNQWYNLMYWLQTAKETEAIYWHWTKWTPFTKVAALYTIRTDNGPKPTLWKLYPNVEAPPDPLRDYRAQGYTLAQCLTEAGQWMGYNDRFNGLWIGNNSVDARIEHLCWKVGIEDSQAFLKGISIEQLVIP